MSNQVLALDNISLTHGGTPLFEGVQLQVNEGDRVALVGRNGSGKSTLLKIAAGLVEPDSGSRFVHPGSTVRYLPQEPDLSAYASVGEFVEEGLTEGDDPFRATYLMEHLGLAPDMPTSRLSGGEARRAALARVLAPKPDLLLLDEPTNHLDLPAIEWLETELKGHRGALVLISHDRRFLSTLTRRTVWLDRARIQAANLGFAQFEEWRDKLLEEEEAAQHKLDRQIAREEHWVRYGVTARRKRNVRRMSELAALRQQKRDHRGPTGQVNLAVSEGRASGAIVIDAKNIGFAFDERPIVENLSLRVLRKDRLALVGPNGAGKTTLINLLTGAIAPHSGEVKLGTNLQMAMLDQKRDQLDPQTSLKDALTHGAGDWVEINGQRRHFAAYMKDFLFVPEQAGTPIGKLSGGERARLMLARALSTPSNFLILDEPTNDLDLETLDLLEELVADYPGTVLLVSHDRDFLDRVASSVLVAEGEGSWAEFAGGYTDMVRQRGHGLEGRAPTAQTQQAKAGKQPGTGKGTLSDKVEATAPARRAKLSFKHQHALKTLPKTIEELQARCEELTKRMADSSFYSRDPDGFFKTGKELESTQNKLHEAESEWLELELLREELEN